MQVTPNWGRDIGPLLTQFGRALCASYDIIGHLHTKKSAHVADRPFAEAWSAFLLEIVEDRYDKGSLIITSQVPVDRWHDLIGVPTLADAILDRVVHNAYRIELAGESLRKRRSSP